MPFLFSRMDSGVGSWGNPCPMCRQIGLVLRSLISQYLVLRIILESCRGQGECSARERVDEKHRRWWRGEPMAGLLLFPTISCRAFLKQSGAEEEEQWVIEVTPYSFIPYD